jgi:uncharacterized protein
MNREIVGRGWTFPPRVSPQGGLSLTNQRNEIALSIQIILDTSPGERVMRPKFGSQLHELVFAPNNSQTAAQAERCVEEALGMWEPRIKVTRTEVYPDKIKPHRLIIEIDYEMKATQDRRSRVYPFYLIPEDTGEAPQVYRTGF